MVEKMGSIRVETLSEENLNQLKKVIDSLKDRVDKKLNDNNLLKELKQLEKETSKRKHRR